MSALLANSLWWIVAIAVMMQAVYVVPCDCAAIDAHATAAINDVTPCCSTATPSCCVGMSDCQCETVCGCPKNERTNESPQGTVTTTQLRTVIAVSSVGDPFSTAPDAALAFTSESPGLSGTTSLERCVLLSRMTL